MVDLWTKRRGRGGFSLVELLVAMAITAMVSVAILALMDSTADSMNMAESSADTLDRTRFAVERVKSQLRNAGSYGSVDSLDDPRYKPSDEYISQRNANSEPLNGVLYVGGWTNDGCMTTGSTTHTARRLAGLVSYDNDNGWQDYAEDVMTSELRTENPESEFDGIVVTGAYDFPVPFEISIHQTGDPVLFKVSDDPSGTYRLGNPDPFDTSTSKPSSFPDTALANSNNRVLRIMDHNGKFQFSPIDTASFDSPNTDQLELGVGGGNRPYFRSDSEPYGLEPCTQQSEDITHRASLLDAYWFRVRQDPTDDTNYQLVRNRLDAGGLVQDLTGAGEAESDWTNWSPTDHVINMDSPAIIADRVVDFQIWFDCAVNPNDPNEPNDPTVGGVEGSTWEGEWSVTAGGSGADEDKNCLSTADPDPARARMAHIRLSMRTSGERDNLAHSPFQGGRTRTMKTFDVYPDSPGAARVVTAQMDFELPNYAAQNIVHTD